MVHLSKTTGLGRIVTADELGLYKVVLDDTREMILEVLENSPRGMTASELSKEFELKLPTIMSHLKKLERVGAVTSRKRRGKNVNRPVVYYRAAVKVGAFRKASKQVDIAVGQFENDLTDAVLQFLENRSDLVPSFDEPVSLSEWVELLLKKVTASIPEAIFRRPARLAMIPKYRSAALKAAALSLVGEISFQLFEQATELANSRNAKLSEIGTKYGVRLVRDAGDALFVLDVVADLLSKNASKKLAAQVALSQLVDLLPARLRWKDVLQELLPYVVRIGEVLDEKTESSLFEFVDVDDDTDSMISKWKANGRILIEALEQKPVLMSAK